MIQPIVQEPSPILRKITQKVTNFRDPKLKKLIGNMIETMLEEDGAGLAAPQINVSVSVFVTPKEFAPKITILTSPVTFFKPRLNMIFINPKIIKYSKEKETIEEGCLSVRNIFHPTTRSKKVVLRAQNEKGQKFRVKGDGLLAQIFQHETDHLNGILFLDRLHEK